jgi:hypothetical protein
VRVSVDETDAIVKMKRAGVGRATTKRGTCYAQRLGKGAVFILSLTGFIS